MALTFGRDHGDIAWGNWLGQFVGKPRLEALVRSLQVPINVLDAALYQVSRSHDLNTAIGAQLDGIGSILGQPRTINAAIYIAFFGYSSQPATTGYGKAPYRRFNEAYKTTAQLNDADYRTILRLKIVLNNAHGTHADILTAAQVMFDEPNILVETLLNGNVWIQIPKKISASDTIYDEAKGFIPKAAGVGLKIFDYAGPAVFGYAGKSNAVGYGKGPYARLLGS